MKHWLLFLFSLTFVTAFAVSAQTEVDGTLTYDGLERTYTIHVPASYNGRQPIPLVIGLHGSGGSAETFAHATHFDGAADAHGFIVVYPNGIGASWNDGRITRLQEAHRLGLDDVGFLAALIETLKAQYAIDRVYMTGISNGGMMSLRFACEMSDQLDGFMSVVGTFPVGMDTACAPANPVPALIIVGEADPIVPYEGGEIVNGTLGSVIPAEQTAAVWTQLNGCAGDGVETALPDTEDDGARTYLSAYDDCAAPVHFYHIENGGHGYPGDTSPHPERIERGVVTQDFDATDIFIEFFGL